MNAVCAFKMSAIDRVFNHGSFKSQRSVNSYSQQKAQNLRGAERPGKCPKDSRSVGDVSFMLKNPLITDLVNAVDQPLLVEGPSKPDLTKVVAIGGVKSVERNQTYDVIYVGRNDGKVVKLIKTSNAYNLDSVLIESISVFDNPPTGIQALWPLLESNELVVVGSDRVAKIPLYHCDRQTSCSRCVALRDPHCAWDTENLVCTHANDWNFGSYVQNIGKGASSQCPEGMGDGEGYAINASPVMDSTKEFRQLLDEAEDGGFSATTIAMIIICAVLMATGLGFLVRPLSHSIVNYCFNDNAFRLDTVFQNGDSLAKFKQLIHRAPPRTAVITIHLDVRDSHDTILWQRHRNLVQIYIQWVPYQKCPTPCPSCLGINTSQFWLQSPMQAAVTPPLIIVSNIRQCW